MLTKRIVMKPPEVGAMQYRKPNGNPCGLSSSTGERQNSKVVYLLPFCFLLFGAGLVGCSNSGFLGLGSLNLSGFGGNITKIGDIQQNPNDANATVYLQGEVTTRAPFLKNGAYRLKDATGAIWVITNQTPPTIGDELLIKGQVQFQSIPLGGQELGEVYVQEEQLLKRKAGKSQSSVKSKK